ncbi:hypothetical protein [Halosimplex halophilum]|uniref:hypothetical protein n=1 Tax=Halosimplex halophilum TaxID=2559572 RepID=UPI00107EFD3B|nr:hypothetical protein [Halosimplex halophilum]
MPVFEKVAGGEVLLRGIGERVSVGDRVDVDGAFAGYLSERGDFERVDDAGEDITADEVESLADDVIAERIDAGECPWCDEYEGENVGQHASSAHPDAWDDYKGE